MKLQVQRTGSLAQIFEKETENAKRAIKAGMTTVTEDLKTRLRSQVTSAGLGSRLANGIRSRTFPRGDSMGAAGLVWARPGKNKSGGAAGILLSYEEGATIRATDGKKYLAIPTENVPPGTQRSYQQVLEKFKDNVILLKRKGGGYLVFLENVRRGKKSLRRIKARKSRPMTVKSEMLLMFVLVPVVRVKKRLDWKQEGDRALALLPDVIVGTWERQG